MALVAAKTSDDPALAAAESAAREAGYKVTAGNCDVGSREALGAPRDAVWTVTIYYFATQSDARQALYAIQARGFNGGVVARVETFCMS